MVSLSKRISVKAQKNFTFNIYKLYNKHILYSKYLHTVFIYYIYLFMILMSSDFLTCISLARKSNEILGVNAYFFYDIYSKIQNKIQINTKNIVFSYFINPFIIWFSIFK